MHQIHSQAPATAAVGLGASSPLCVPAELSCQQWYAVNTRSRHEKSVSRLLEGKSVEVFLPVYESVHRWNDRNAVVSQPIFPGYVFARICLADRMQVLSVPGVVNFVGPLGRPASIPEEELTAVRLCLDRQVKMEPHPFLVLGRRVRIRQGLLADMEGVLVRKKGLFRLVLSVNLIARSVAVEVDAHDVVPIGGYALQNPHQDNRFA